MALIPILGNVFTPLHIGLYMPGASSTIVRKVFQMDISPEGKNSIVVRLPQMISGDFAIAVCQDIIIKQKNNIFNPSPFVLVRKLPKSILMDQFNQCRRMALPGVALFDIPLTN